MAGRGKGVLRIAIEDWFETFAFGKVLTSWFKDWGEDQEFEINQVNDDLMQILRETKGLPDVINNMANFKKGDDLQGGIATALSFASQIGSSAAGGLFAPFLRIIGQQSEMLARSQLPDLSTLIQLNRRGLTGDIDYGVDLAKTGWPDEYIKAFEIFTLQLLGASDLLTLWRREEINATELKERLLEQGFSETVIEELKILTEVIPGVGDLINMSVKEAFNPAIVKKFGYDQEFPEEVAIWAEKQGLSREWAERFWFAHWLTPSIGQGFEMLHRLRPGVGKNTFVESDMRELLKILDVPVYWRDKLIDISYNPLTRVDVRRMHDLGNLDENGVLDAYLDSGYNQKNAELMRDFTLDYNKEPIKLLSKEVVLKAFKRGLFTEPEAIEILINSGWTSEQTNFYISIASYDMMEKETDLQIDLIHDLYLAGEIVKSSAHADLNSLNLPDTQVERLIKEWELEKLKKVRLPSETELEQFYELGYITSDQYKSGLVSRNYKLDMIDFYVRQADQRIADKLQKQELALMDAKEKLQLDLLASDYRKAQLNLSVLIAQEKSNIAELKLIAHDIEDEEVLIEIKTNIAYIQLLIKNMQLEKAKLKLAEEEEAEEEA